MVTTVMTQSGRVKTLRFGIDSPNANKAAYERWTNEFEVALEKLCEKFDVQMDLIDWTIDQLESLAVPPKRFARALVIETIKKYNL